MLQAVGEIHHLFILLEQDFLQEHILILCSYKMDSIFSCVLYHPDLDKLTMLLGFSKQMNNARETDDSHH